MEWKGRVPPTSMVQNEIILSVNEASVTTITTGTGTTLEAEIVQQDGAVREM